MALKSSQQLKISKKNRILSNHFIGFLYGISNVLILLGYPEKLKENVLLLNIFGTPKDYPKDPHKELLLSPRK